MSLLEPFRKLWSKNNNLEEKYNNVLQENNKLKEQVEYYKRLVYNIEIVEAAKRFKK